jgi:hypothetical protein
MMNNDFDFEKIGKKIPYSVPESFFENITKLTLEKARQRNRKIKIRKLLVLYSSAASVLILIAIGYLVFTGKHDRAEITIAQSVTEEKVLENIQPDEIFIADTIETQIEDEPEIQPATEISENSIEKLIAGMSEEELRHLETVLSGELIVDEIINN